MIGDESGFRKHRGLATKNRTQEAAERRRRVSFVDAIDWIQKSGATVERL